MGVSVTSCRYLRTTCAYKHSSPTGWVPVNYVCTCGASCKCPANPLKPCNDALNARIELLQKTLKAVRAYQHRREEREG